jgi:uncharacterized membrane protein (DUF2068 family)
MVPGLEVGGICADCWRLVRRRAARIGRWVAMGTTLPLAVYMMLTLPPLRSVRMMAAVSVVIWYVLTSLIARRIAQEWMK